jgi:ribonuclease HI
VKEYELCLILGGFVKLLGSCNILMAEIWGVLEGLQYAWSLGFWNLELRIDS